MEPFNLYMFQYNLIHSSTSKVGKAKDHIYFYIRKEDFFFINCYCFINRMTYMCMLFHVYEILCLKHSKVLLSCSEYT